MSNKRTLIVVYRRATILNLYTRTILSAKYNLKKQYSIAVGAIGFETPAGVYSINSRAKCPDWLVPDSQWARDAGLVPGTIVPGCTDANPLKVRWLGITDPKDGVGIHGTASVESLGTAASHGCIRMNPSDIIELYKLVPKGTPIVIL